MQYLLSEEELKNLVDRKEQNILKATRELQEFCTLAANHIPVAGWGDDYKPEPWGCILTNKGEWYCDECPALKFCPHPEKEFSK